jgi:hypothetical protein
MHQLYDREAHQRKGAWLRHGHRRASASHRTQSALPGQEVSPVSAQIAVGVAAASHAQVVGPLGQVNLVHVAVAVEVAGRPASHELHVARHQIVAPRHAVEKI